jgi:hypothetical protein
MRRRQQPIIVVDLNGQFGKLNLASCVSAQVNTDGPYPTHAIHKTQNKRWFIEEYNQTRHLKGIREVTLDQAVDWCLKHAADRERALSELGILTELPDVSKSKVPRHGGDIVVRCLSCARRRKRVVLGRGKKRTSIRKVLDASTTGLSGKEIAARAGVKNDSALYGILSEWVAAGIVVNKRKIGGYILADRLAPKNLS